MSELSSKFQSEKSFLQSSLWAGLQDKSHYPSQKIGESFFIEKPLFLRKHYLYGSRIKADDLSILEKDNQAVFVRFEPNSADWEGKGVKTIPVQPAKTIILDLTKSEEELLSAMHQKTRYNIRLAEKKGVTVTIDNSRINEFLALMNQTTERDGFFAHSDGYYRAMAEFDPDFIQLILAEYEGRVIAAGLFCFCAPTAIYMHGASSNEFRNVMAPYLLQWTAIKKAKGMNLKYYDFYGIDEKKWPGVTRFKEGFGGEEINYAGTFDLVLKPFWYFIYRLLRHVRRALKKKI
ncbi:MAG: peptidoglycan bridge formation glycyltransferase FemA/FemB family protein [Candidatus Falkowbacteria bacterium]